MPQFDVAIGLKPATLDHGVASLFANSQAREKLFKGTQEGEEKGLAYKAAWDIQQPPTFLFSPPPDDKWAAAVDAKGAHPKPADKPTTNVVQVNFPQLHATYTMLEKTVQGTGQAIVFAIIMVAGNKLSITPLAVWIDETKMAALDQAILNHGILPRVLAQAKQLLAGLTIPPLNFSEQGATIDLTTPVVTVVNNTLVMGASLKSKKQVDLNGAVWPDQPFFVLLSPDVMASVTSQMAASWKGKEYTGDGDYKKVLKYTYDVNLSGADVVPDQHDRTRMRIEANVTFSAELKPLGIGGPCSVTAASDSM